ncbi:DNA topoisomerase 2-binding protein 1 [Hyposmocoma kahamanoa]|uniref:DNA topoisomerase 2-binding protein 1 n=1 Tax=Hyposmocoma kahamanoa TaxID=1477025 RepID=UPI000E6D71E6|nr:DNA topoisomerase 2-binding protein 1 [Hyposmocoma kahamanoa]
MKEDIKVTFIIPKYCRSENDCSEEMQLAFTACEQHSGGGLQAQWIHETRVDKFEGLTKTDVFVLTDFEGELYEKLKCTKCLLVGPRCLSCCMTEGTPIPSGPEPVFTVAMRGLVVTASGLSKLQKENIKKKVYWMGGIYNAALTDDTTHLVSDTVLSDKYVKSIQKGIPVMSESWIEAVWNASLSLNVNGSSPDFDSHRLPPFANLQVTTSGITKKDKQLITKLVNEHGGTFSGAFQSETTDVVVLTKEGVGSDKYKAALEYGKACVTPAWVKESAAKGVALPLALYRVAGASTSSPLAEHRLPDMSLNFSRITNIRPPNNFVDETRATDMSSISSRTKLSQESKRNDMSVDKEIQTALENLDLSTIRKAGPIFDGFCIWVTGLDGVCRERASACVSRAGGVRYDRPHERVTHIVAGTRQAAASALLALPAVPILTPLWLVRSVDAGRALDEAEFLINTKPPTPKSSRPPRVEPASPMSKRNLQLLRRELDLPPPTPELPEPPEPQQDELVNHYLSQHLPPEPEREKTPEPAPNATRQDQTDVTDEPTEEIEQIFRGIKMEVQGLDEEAICEIGAEVAAAGGALAAAGAGGSHVLLPLDFDPGDLLTRTAEPVTVFWVKDCLSQQELLPIDYYHRPVKLSQWGQGPGPLHGVVASLSTYSGVERAFLDELAKLLGATTQLRFCRRNTANALASTHLICPSPVGDKYIGALKWGLPAVTAAWLLACAEEGRRVSEKNFLVGETKAPPSPEPAACEDAPPVPPEPEKENIDENAMRPPPPVTSDVPRRGSVPSREHTPKLVNVADGDHEMSPASRYIAMARQGLLGGDSQETPKRVQNLKDDAKQVQGYDRKTEADQADTPPAKIAKITTDQSAGGNSTDASDCIKNTTVNTSKSANESTKSSTPSNASSAASVLPPALDAQLQRLSAALSGLTSQRARRVTRDSVSRPIDPESEPGPESQPNTVGWDDTTPGQQRQQSQDIQATVQVQTTPQVKRFMLSSNVDNREEIIEMIQYLGGEVCEGTELDLEASHLLCAAPGRSEKMLGSIAAGRWVLHPAYIVRSRAVGSFLSEEEFEWGNPKATCLPQLSGTERTLANAAYRWRSTRAQGAPGPFAGVVALLHVPAARRRLLARLVTAGDGLAPDDEPPYNNEDITVCFADIKRYQLSDRDASWLKSRSIPVCAPVLLSSYLTDDVPPSPEQHCLPDYRPR